MSATDDLFAVSLDESGEASITPVQGWRIARLQVVNWGGFDGWHDVVFDDAGTILTGGSGAGKSTLLDAYIALMMSAKVPFNNASNAGRGRARGDGQRSVLTYVRGKIDSTVVDGETVDRTLRGNANAWGAVAVTFERSRPGGVDDVFTSARLWHVPRSARNMEDVRVRLVTSDGPLDLRSAEADASEQFANLRSIYGTGLTVHPQPGSFAARLYQRLHIGNADNGDKAMSLLASVQAGRSVHDVVGLYRDLVLEEPATFAAAQAAVDHFAALQAAHEAMVDAENQQTALAPIREAHTAREVAIARMQAIDALGPTSSQGGFAVWRARTLVALADNALISAKSTLAVAAAEVGATRSREAAALNRRDQALAALNDAAGDLPKLLSEAASFRTDLVKAEHAARQLAAAIAPAGVDVSTMAGFLAAQNEAERLNTTPDEDAQKLEDRAADLRREGSDLVLERNKLIDDRDDLTRRGGKISGDEHRIRCEIASLIGLEPTELPFVAELFDLAPEHEDWRDAADVVLRGFATQLVIDSATYNRVRDTLNPRRFTRRFRFIGAEANLEVRYDATPDTLAETLVVNRSSRWAGWLHQQLLREANHLRVQDVTDLVGDNIARVTRSGQTRRGQRGAHGGHNRPLIGFSSQQVIDSLQARIDDIEDRLGGLATEERVANGERKARQARRDALLSIRAVTWDSVDVELARGLLEAAEEEVERAKTANPDLARLDEEAEQAQRTWVEANTASHEAVGRHNEAQTAAARLEQVLTDYRPAVAAAKAELQPEQLDILEECCKSVGSLDIDQIDASSQRILKGLAERRDAAERDAAQRARQLAATFETYANRWPDPNRGTGMASAGEYLAILDALETAGLAKVRDAFLNAVNRWSGDDVNAVRSAMETAVDEITTRIGAINMILSGIPFGHPNAPNGTAHDHLLIRTRRFEPDTVSKFRKRLNELSAPVVTGDAAEAARRFDAYRRLNTELQSSDRAVLLDVRRHIHITAERVTPDGTVVAQYDTLGGKSGGETQELIAFIVGSALRYRLGGEPTHGPAFAPVLLDEAFIKADALFAGRAVTAWKRLGFQLVIAAPVDKYQALEPHIPRTLFIDKTNTGRSLVRVIERA
ncbi:MAG: ATP-binding protein [Acidimicrobiales bacterium]